MSQLKVNSIVDAAGGSSAVLYGVASPPNSMGFRNRIINGEMRIDQRNAGASSTPSGSGFVTVDRFAYYASQASKITIGQNLDSVTPPAGFRNYLGLKVAATATVGASDYFLIGQPIEGYNVADLMFGSASAATVTVSFWVRSSSTGTFGAYLKNADQNRSYPFTYTVSAANTWEQKTVTIPGDTTGTWGSTNGQGINLYFTIGSGSSVSFAPGSWGANNALGVTGATSVVGTSGATFYITGVQLEAGSVASPFERRDYGRELMMCSRYFQKSYQQDTVGGTSTFTGASFIGAGTQGAALTTGYIEAREPFPVRMRTSPTVTGWDTSGNLGKCTRFNPNTANNTNELGSFASTERYVNCTSTSGASASTIGFHWYCSAEL